MHLKRTRPTAWLCSFYVDTGAYRPLSATHLVFAPGASVPPKAMAQPSPFPSFPLPLLPYLLSPFLPFLPLLCPSLPCPPLPLEVGPLNPARGLGERSPSRNGIWCILALKCDIWWQQFYTLSPLTSLFLSPPEDFCDAFCVAPVLLNHPFYQKYSSLGWCPKVNFWELLWENFYRPDALPVAQPTASNHWSIQTCNLKTMQ